MVTKANNDIRTLARVKDVKLWEIAKELKTTDSYFCRKLRIELSSDEKKRIIGIINQIADNRE